MHDKYYYEATQMALIDTNVRRTFATGIAGFSHVVDSLSAIKYAKVKTIRDEDASSSIMRWKVTSRVMEMMMTVPMISLYGCSRRSWARSKSVTLTVTRSRRLPS